jgi:hypothetical protein
MSRQRYRITITAIETDGSPCSGRSTIEFEQRSHDNWMHLLETRQRRRNLCGDQCTALTVATQLLKDLTEHGQGSSANALAQLQPELSALLKNIDALDT